WSLVPPRRGAARPRRTVVRALGRLGGARRPGHARRAVVRLDSRRRLREPVPPLQRAHAARERRLVRRARRRRLGPRLELGPLPPRVPLRRLRRRGGTPRPRGVLGDPAAPHGYDALRPWRYPTLTSRRSTRP